MENQEPTTPVITQDCTNFKNYLQNTFNVEKFGEFICAYTFPYEELENLQRAATKANKKPASFRIYYGCEADGTDHKLHLALIDDQGQVIVDSTNLPDNGSKLSDPNFRTLIQTRDSTELETPSFATVRKCPPGGTSDAFVQTLLV